MAKIDKRSPWDGCDPHPVVTAISQWLESKGFETAFGGLDYSWFYRWRKKAFEELELFVEVRPNRSFNGIVDFSVSVGGMSQQYTDAENKLRTWECDPNGMIPTEDVPFQYPLDMVRVGLHWLMLNAEPPMHQLTWQATAQDAGSSAAKLGDDLERYGFIFLDQIDSREKLITLLQNIEYYPRKTPAPGPTSPEPSLCAALLLYLGGNLNAALRELESGFRQDTARCARTWANNQSAYDEAIHIRRCKIERYRALFEGK